MQVVLTRKLAETMDGIDVAGRQVGDVLDLTPAEAELLIAEEWAIADRRRTPATPRDDERRGTAFSPGAVRGDGGVERES
jgi:hypothetical protein